MRLFILSLALVAIASCKPGNSTTNTNSQSATRGDEASGSPTMPNEPCVNLNIATAEDLIKLPGIGEVMAKKIIDYRGSHGLFRRPQEIIIIEGFSERKYRAIARMICDE